MRWVRRFGYAAKFSVALEGRIHNRFRELCIERGEACSSVLRRAIYEYCGEVEPVKVRDEENAHAD